MPAGIESRKTYLIGASTIHYTQLPVGFIFYDTLYVDGMTQQHYELPKTQLIILILFTDSERVWTTIRRFTEEKYDYYKKLIGQEIKVVIEG